MQTPANKREERRREGGEERGIILYDTDGMGRGGRKGCESPLPPNGSVSRLSAGQRVLALLAHASAVMEILVAGFII